jgi:hypothetical protein
MHFPWARNRNTTRQPRLMEGQDDYIFRRSRTITGTVSEVIASDARQGQLKTDRQKKVELILRRRQLLNMLAGILFVCVVIGLFLANFILIPDVKSTTLIKNQSVFEDYRRDIIAYFGLHPLERLGFALNEDEIGKYLVRVNNEVASVKVTRDWYGGGAQFAFSFRTPILVWQSGHQRFYVDEQGVAFKNNLLAEPAVSVSDQSGMPPDSSGMIVSSRFIHFLGRTVSALNGYDKGKVTSVVIPASTREVDIKLEGRDYIIKAHSDRDPLQQAEDIANGLMYFDQHGIKPQYIDARVAHKVFYK